MQPRRPTELRSRSPVVFIVNMLAAVILFVPVIVNIDTRGKTEERLLAEIEAAVPQPIDKSDIIDNKNDNK